MIHQEDVPSLKGNMNNITRKNKEEDRNHDHYYDPPQQDAETAATHTSSPAAPVLGGRSHFPLPSIMMAITTSI
jgi:hypothetical protein